MIVDKQISAWTKLSEAVQEQVLARGVVHKFGVNLAGVILFVKIKTRGDFMMPRAGIICH